MAVVIAGERFEARIEEMGAELKSLRDRQSGAEYIWPGDQTWWSGSAPILFPNVGGLKNNKYTHRGAEYSLPQHGFARRSLFTLAASGASGAALELSSGEETRRQYPFDFRLRATFLVQDSGLAVQYEVTNTGSGEMLFSIGSHPALRVPFAGGQLENYYLHFGEEENLERHFFDNGLMLDQTAPAFDTSRQIFLRPDLFERGVLIFKHPASGIISIRNSQNPRSVSVTTGGAPYLGVWAKPGRCPFLCIEPWYGLPDSPGATGELSEKEGILRLEAGGTFTCTYRLEVA
jgi:galactose mutarotase-like enzyme